MNGSRAASAVGARCEAATQRLSPLSRLRRCVPGCRPLREVRPLGSSAAGASGSPRACSAIASAVQSGCRSHRHRLPAAAADPCITRSQLREWCALGTECTGIGASCARRSAGPLRGLLCPLPGLGRRPAAHTVTSGMSGALGTDCIGSYAVCVARSPTWRVPSLQLARAPQSQLRGAPRPAAHQTRWLEWCALC